MDASRGLTSKGQRQVKLMRQFRKDLGIKFDVVFSSDFQRAVETLPVANKKAPVYRCKELRPNGTPEEAWAFILGMIEFEQQSNDDEKVLVITHDPLIQQLAASVCFAFSPDHNGFPHCAMLRVDTHPLEPENHSLRWFVTPDLVEHMYEQDVVESATRLTEHLGQASKARIVDPLIEKLRAAVSARFKRQRRLYEQLGTAALYLNDSTFARRFESVTNRAYFGGVQHVAGQLAVLQEAAPVSLTTRRQPTGYERMPDDLEADIDATTRDRIASINSDGLEKGLTGAAIAAAIRQQFRDWAGDRAQTIAENEVSRAFHAGGADVAGIVVGEGTAVEKKWDGEPDACEEICQPNIDQGWIAEDEIFESGDSEPPGHVNCRCSLDYRTVGQSEEARR